MKNRQIKLLLILLFLVSGCEQKEADPTAAFSLQPVSGTLDTVFMVDASASSDEQTASAALEVRWDWTSDGNWDSEWTTEKTATHQYTTEGAHSIKLAVRDEDGNTAQQSEIATVALPIPPLNTLVMDFSDFDDTGIGQSPTKGEQVMTSANWGYAAATVGIWNIVITVNLVIPVAAFTAAFEQVPEQQPDGSWIWSYQFMAGGQPHMAQLVGNLDGDGFHWDMYITRDTQYLEFNWFSGDCNLLLTSGSWTLNRSPNEPEPYIGIAWQRTPGTELADIRYTNIIPGSPANGGFIHHGIVEDPRYDAFYNIYGIVEDRLIEIEWSRMGNDGQVRDEVHFEDPDWHCWDQLLQDIDCQ